MITWLTALATGATPTMELTWKGEDGRLAVVAPSGFAVAADGPALVDLWLADRSIVASLPGISLSSGLPVGDPRGADIRGEVGFVLCAKDTGQCTPARWTVAGTASAKKRGTSSLTVTAITADAPRIAEVPHDFGPDATAVSVDAAFARAAVADKHVLLDFSAVWCPPCMVLAAEVLHADPLPSALDGFEVAILDVDHPSSFALKDRYGVGGYPTTIVVDADGRELTRQVGYDGRDSYVAWLANAATSTEGTDLRRLPAEVSPDRAAQLAWTLVQRHEMDAALPWIARAEAGDPDHIDLRLAQIHQTATPEGIRWLADRAPERAEDWAFAVTELAEDHPELARRAAHLAVAHADGSGLADALYLAASVTDDEASAQTLYAAAASTVSGALTGDDAHDKGHITWLARLQTLSGDLDAGRALLEAWADRYPEEPTFDLTLSPLLLQAGDPQGALTSADRAVERAWGDNRLRAAHARAEALVALDRRDDAAETALQALAFEADPGLDVRTHRYRDRLRAFVEID